MRPTPASRLDRTIASVVILHLQLSSKKMKKGPGNRSAISKKGLFSSFAERENQLYFSDVFAQFLRYFHRIVSRFGKFEDFRKTRVFSYGLPVGVFLIRAEPRRQLQHRLHRGPHLSLRERETAYQRRQLLPCVDDRL